MVVDWGEMAKAPCYPAAVRNIRVAAHCAAAQLEFLRKGGLDISRMTCVGHSLGAHTCGLLASYVTFRLHKIIGIQFCFFENPIIIGSCFSFHSLFFFFKTVALISYPSTNWQQSNLLILNNKGQMEVFHLEILI